MKMGISAGKRSTHFELGSIISFCNVSSGNLVVNEGEVLERWKEYFADLLGQGDQSSEATKNLPVTGKIEDIPPPR